MPARIPIPAARLLDLAEFGKSKWTGYEFQRYLCVWLRAEKDMPSVEIANIVGWHVNTVRFVQRDFIERGTVAFSDNKRGGRNFQLMTREEEERLLGFFRKAGSDASMLVVNVIKAAYEDKVGHPVHKTTIYRLLKRHGWRKIVSRPKHPKQNKEAVEAFKKGAMRKG